MIQGCFVFEFFRAEIRFKPRLALKLEQVSKQLQLLEESFVLRMAVTVTVLQRYCLDLRMYGTRTQLRRLSQR